MFSLYSITHVNGESEDGLQDLIKTWVFFFCVVCSLFPPPLKIVLFFFYGDNGKRSGTNPSMVLDLEILYMMVLGK